MQWVDLAMLAVLAISVVVGLVRGFLFEMLSLAGWFVAYVAAQWFAADLAPQVPVGKPGSSLNHGAAFAAIFVAAIIVWAIASRLLRFLIHATPLSVPDRLLGAVFGLARGLLMLLVAATVIAYTPLVKSPHWQASLGAHWLHAALDGLRPLLPPQISNHLPAAASVPAR